MLDDCDGDGVIALPSDVDDGLVDGGLVDGDGDCVDDEGDCDVAGAELDDGAADDEGGCVTVAVAVFSGDLPM